MSADQKHQVHKANEAFYAAIRGADMSRMTELWLDDPKSKCVHPGWPMIYGWEAIKESWANIFEAGGLITDIEVSGITLEVSGTMAWVICVEKIGHRVGDEIRIGYAQSTNVFEYTNSSWKMVVHHASPIPVPRTEMESTHNLQ